MWVMNEKEHKILEKEKMEEYSNIISDIESIIIRYNKSDLLKWLSATGVLPGNELFNCRFEFLIYLVASIPDKRFLGKTLGQSGFLEILRESDRLEWYSIEDFEPPENSKKQVFGLNCKEYNYFRANLDDPVGTLESICKRFYEFEQKIEEKCGYRPIEELEKLLSYQTFLIRVIDSENHYKKIGKIRIPEKCFIDKWIENLKKAGIPFSEKFSNDLIQSEFKDFHKNYVFSDSDELVKKPIIDGIIYPPWSLILSFRDKLLRDVSKFFQEEDDNILRDQLLRETLENLLEIVPKKAIEQKLKINKIKDELDFGIVFDDIFFVIQVIEDRFSDKKSVVKKIDEVQEIFRKVNFELKKSDIELYMQGQKIKLEGGIVPYFIIILDDIKPKAINFENKTGSESFFVISNSCFKYILEDIEINDSKDLGYLAKVFDTFKKLKSTTGFLMCYTFCDFYELLNGSLLLLRSPIGLLVDPHAWSRALNKKYREFPRFDYRPDESFYPHTFKVKRVFKNTYFGKNRLLDLFFYCFVSSDIQIYFVFGESSFRKKEDFNTAIFLCEYFSFFLEDFEKNGLLKGMKFKKVIRLFPIEFAIKNKIVSEKTKSPILIGVAKEDKNQGIVIYDSLLFNRFFNSNPKNILNSLVNILENDITKAQRHELYERIKLSRPKDFFRISNVIVSSKIESRPHVFYPTIMDEVNSEFTIKKFVEDKFTPGIYERDSANKIVRSLYFYLVEELRKMLSLYEIRSFVEFAYRENENALKLREFLSLHALHSKDMKTSYDPFEFLSKEEEKLRWYSPSCRYLIEEALSSKNSGTKRMTINEWRSIVPIARRIIDLSYISDFLRYAPDDIDIKVELKQDGISFELITNENPFQKYFQSFITGIRGRKVGFVDDVIEIEKKQEIDVKKIFIENRSLFDIEKAFQDSFGFGLVDYLIIINSLSHLEDKLDVDGLLRITTKELIKFLVTKTKIDEKIIKNVIEFSKLSPKSFIRPPEPFKVNSRKNRLLIKPIVDLEDSLVLGINTINIFALAVAPIIFDGEWLYSRENIPKNLRVALDKRKLESSKEFEKEIRNEIKKYADFIEHNVCKTPGENNKCFSSIKEHCPGEIDIISVHSKKKKLILWEAKHIGYGFGSREIVAQLEKFKSEYLRRLELKTKYVKSNLKSILDYFGIKELTGWSVESTFVLSKPSIVQYILPKHTKIIIWDEIKDFLKGGL